MAGFEVTTSGGSDQAVVAVAGECDLTVRDELTSVLLAADRHGGSTVFNRLPGPAAGGGLTRRRSAGR